MPTVSVVFGIVDVDGPLTQFWSIVLLFQDFIERQ